MRNGTRHGDVVSLSFWTGLMNGEVPISSTARPRFRSLNCASRVKSDSSHAIKRGEAPWKVDNVAPVRRCPNPKPHGDIRHVLPHLELHLFADLFLGGGRCRIKTGVSQRLQPGTVWPALKARFPVAADPVVCRRAVKEQTVVEGEEDIPPALVARLLAGATAQHCPKIHGLQIDVHTRLAQLVCPHLA